MRLLRKPLAAALAFALTLPTFVLGQIKGPSTVSTPYLLPTQSGIETISVITVDNTGLTADDSVSNLTTASPYGLAGLPDGEGAFDNGDGTFTVLVNHEIASGGAVRAHGTTGAFVSKWVINKNTLSVTGGDCRPPVRRSLAGDVALNAARRFHPGSCDTESPARVLRG